MFTVKYCSKSFIITGDSEEIETKFQGKLSKRHYQIVLKRSTITSLERVLCFDYYEVAGYL